MKYIQIKICTLLISGVGLISLQAQESVNAAGGEALGIGGTASFSAGQLFCNYQPEAGWLLAEGVQQPYEISLVTGLDEIGKSGLSFSVYPNPANNYLTLTTGEAGIKNHSLLLYDLSGKLLQHRKITTSDMKINMTNLRAGTYLLKIIDTESETPTIKLKKAGKELSGKTITFKILKK
jgi:hypothetical protein